MRENVAATLHWKLNCDTIFSKNKHGFIIINNLQLLETANLWRHSGWAPMISGLGL